MTDHDIMMLSAGFLLMASNLVGAGFTVRRLRSRRRAAAEAAGAVSSISIPLSGRPTFIADNTAGKVFVPPVSEALHFFRGAYGRFDQKAVVTSDVVSFSGTTQLDLRRIVDMKMWVREPWFSPTETHAQEAERKLFELTLTTASVHVSVSSLNISGIMMLKQEILQAIERRGTPKTVVVELDNAEVDVWTRAVGG